jgi:hypothetical protein
MPHDNLIVTLTTLQEVASLFQKKGNARILYNPSGAFIPATEEQITQPDHIRNTSIMMMSAIVSFYGFGVIDGYFGFFFRRTQLLKGTDLASILRQLVMTHPSATDKEIPFEEAKQMVLTKFKKKTNRSRLSNVGSDIGSTLTTFTHSSHQNSDTQASTQSIQTQKNTTKKTTKK